MAVAEAGPVLTVSHPAPVKPDAAPIESGESDRVEASEPPPPVAPAPAAPTGGQVRPTRNTPHPPPQAVPLVAYTRYQPPPSRWQKFREKHWPGPAKAEGRAVPAAVLAAALGFVLFVPLNRTGIGWFLGWLVLTAGVVAAVRRTANLSRTEVWIRSGWAAAALALLLVLTFRNAWWLVTFSVIGALGCAALAIVGGQRVRSILFSLVAAPYAAFKGIPWVRRHLRASRNPGIARRVVFSVALTAVVLFVFGALLSSADVAFSTLLDKAVPTFHGGSIFKWIFLAVVGGLIAVAGTYTLSAPPATGSLDTEGRGRFGLVEWALTASALVLLFAGFVAVQFTVLFGGDRHVLKTSGLSYAEYARSGFWQLVAVTLLSLALLAALARWARRDEPLERMLLRVLLGLLCGLSVVIVVSALSRMWAYQRVYSFTGERIFVMSSELLLGVVFILIAAARRQVAGRVDPGRHRRSRRAHAARPSGPGPRGVRGQPQRRPLRAHRQDRRLVPACPVRRRDAGADPPARPGTPLHAELDRRRPQGARPMVRVEPRPFAGPGGTGAPRPGRGRHARRLPRRRPVRPAQETALTR
nr:hypothetical protein GCM10020092_074160 [Actinoplanes digitatis]